MDGLHWYYVETYAERWAYLAYSAADALVQCKSEHQHLDRFDGVRVYPAEDDSIGHIEQQRSNQFDKTRGVRMPGSSATKG